MKDLETQSEEYAWSLYSDKDSKYYDRVGYKNESLFTGEDIQDAYESGYNQAIKDMQSGGNKEE